MLPTNCCRHKCFPVCPRAQYLLRDTNQFCARDTKMFLILFRNILCPQQMFRSLRSPGNIMSNNLSSFASAFRMPIEKSRDEFLTSGKGNIGVYVISIAFALRWVYKPLTWTKKTVSFKIISGWCQFKSHVTSYSLLEKPIYLHLKLKKRCSRGIFR